MPRYDGDGEVVGYEVYVDADCPKCGEPGSLVYYDSDFFEPACWIAEGCDCKLVIYRFQADALDAEDGFEPAHLAIFDALAGGLRGRPHRPLTAGPTPSQSGPTPTGHALMSLAPDSRALGDALMPVAEDLSSFRPPVHDLPDRRGHDPQAELIRAAEALLAALSVPTPVGAMFKATGDLYDAVAAAKKELD